MEFIKSDTFVEQLVKIKGGLKVKALKIAIWAICSLLAAGLIVISILNIKFSFFLLLIAAASLFCAFYMCGQLNKEFEYIITNRDIDIDCIVNGRKRVRMATFNVDDIQNIEKYDANRHKTVKGSHVNVYFGCTPDDTAYAFYIKHPKKGHYILVITPNEKFKEALKKTVSYNLKKMI